MPFHHVLTDPEARIEAEELVESLQTNLDDSTPEQAATAQVTAAAVLHIALDSQDRAAQTAWGALQHDPKCGSALQLLLEIEQRREDWDALDRALEKSLEVVSAQAVKDRLSAKRADVLGIELGRLAQARGMYRTLSKSAQSEELKEEAARAASAVDQLMVERRTQGARYSPVVVGRVELSPQGAIQGSVQGQIDRALELLASRLFERAKEQASLPNHDRARVFLNEGLELVPSSKLGRHVLEELLLSQDRAEELVEALRRYGEQVAGPQGAEILADAARIADEHLDDWTRAQALYRQALGWGADQDQLLSDALRRGVRRKQLDFAAAILPGLEREARVARLRQIAEAAQAIDDQKLRTGARAAAFFDAPEDPELFEAAMELCDAEQAPPVLEARLKVVESPGEKRALYVRLAQAHRDSQNMDRASEAILEIIRTSSGAQSVDELLSALDQYSQTIENRALFARALGAAAGRDSVSAQERRRHLGALAQLLESEMDDPSAAEAVRSELEESSGEADEPSLEDDELTPEALLEPGFEEADPTVDMTERRGLEISEAERSQMREAVSTLFSEEPQQTFVPPPGLEEPEPTARTEAARITPEPESSLIPLDPDTITRLHIRAGDLQSLEEHLLEVIEREDALSARSWLQAGRFFRNHQCLAESRFCYRKALALTEQPSLYRRAADGLAECNDCAGAARALIISMHTHDGARVSAQEIGLLFVEGGENQLGRWWLNEAMARRPSPRVQAALITLGEPVEAPILAHESQIAFGRDRLEQGDFSAARDAFARALKQDEDDLSAAQLLYQTGRKAGRLAWMEEGLLEWVQRSYEHRDLPSAFVGAAVLSAISPAHPKARLIYERLRVTVELEPSGELGHLLPSTVGRALSAPPLGVAPEEVQLEPALADALVEVAARFGCAATPVVKRLPSGGPRFWVDPEQWEIGVRASILRRLMPATARFHFGRAIAALMVPALAPAITLSEARSPEERLAVSALDRAGLAAISDPMVGLQEVDPRSGRGAMLADWAVSEGFVSLFRGAGVVGIAKAPPANLEEPYVEDSQVPAFTEGMDWKGVSSQSGRFGRSDSEIRGPGRPETADRSSA